MRTPPRPGDSRRGVSPPGKSSRCPAGPKAIVGSRDAALATVAVRRRVRVKMSQDGFTVGGIGEPDEAGADAVGPVVSTASVPCVGLL